MDIKTKLKKLQEELEIIEKIPCTKEEADQYDELIKENKELPPDVFCFSEEDSECLYCKYYRYKTNLSYEEKEEYLLLYQTKQLIIIKRCAIYFTGMSIIGVLLSIIF